MEETGETLELTLMSRKPCFGLPTACTVCLPTYLYLKLAQKPFQLAVNSTYPDSDQIPYIEAGAYVAYNNEGGGLIEQLRRDGIVDLDAAFRALPEWISMKALIRSWLTEALVYELWIGTDGNPAWQIYYSDLPWPIGKLLFLKQSYILKKQFDINKENAEQREKELYERASEAYGALSTKIGENNLLFDERPSSLDAEFLAHVLIALHALPENSMLRSKLLEHDNIVRYAEKLKSDFIDAGSSSSTAWHQSTTPPSSSRRGPSRWSSKSKSRQKREKTEEEKAFKRKAKYFLAAQFIGILLYLSIMGGMDFTQDEVEDDDDGIGYN